MISGANMIVSMEDEEKDEKNWVFQTVHEVFAGNLVLSARNRYHPVVPDESAEYSLHGFICIRRFCAHNRKHRGVSVPEDTGNACLHLSSGPSSVRRRDFCPYLPV